MIAGLSLAIGRALTGSVAVRLKQCGADAGPSVLGDLAILSKLSCALTSAVTVRLTA